MKISTKFNIMILGIIISTILLMIFTFLSLNNISHNIKEHQNKNTPLMITSLSLQKDIIQIQQWLTDISATRAKPGFDDGFEEASGYYESAKKEIQVLRELGADTGEMDSIAKKLDEYYKMGIDMANAYINDGTDAGNTFMKKFDPYAMQMEEQVSVLLEEADAHFTDGNNKIDSSINDFYKRSAILFSVILLISIFSFFVIQNIVIKRLYTMVNMLKDISEGEGDLTKRVEIKIKDEIGIMAMYFNNFAETVNNIVSSVKELSDKVVLSTEELTTLSQRSAVNAEEVAQVINKIAKSSIDQSQSTIEGSEKIMELGDLIVEDKIYLQTLTESSSEVNDLIKQGLDIIDRLSTKTKESSHATHSVYDNIIKTSKSSGKISEASTLIATIAHQTNLLALNASIEAARAGENGKGFTIVAEEIKKLAEQSTDSTKMIDNMVRNLQKDATNSVTTMEKVETILNEQIENINLTAIKYKAMDKAIEKSKKVIVIINETAQQMEQKKSKILATIQGLSAVAEKNAVGTEQASASIQEQAASSEGIANASLSLSEMFQELQALIARFKV